MRRRLPKKPRQPEGDECIEWLYLHWAARYWSVEEYSYDVLRARAMNSSDERARAGLHWTEIAPLVEDLTFKPKPRYQEFRICDWDLYDAQMREMIGLDPLPAGPATREGS